jgi:hypothetical protein
MPSQSVAPEYWLLRAEEARVIAEQMRYPEARLSMLQIAEIYTRLAERLRVPAQQLEPRN